mmetsp:Transcript_12035/g.23847  ORF Transcript_12035/g.23847 Transcript_12035/m.23847 type:complete len:219 (-) Transcript_12035:561-1217(-)
MPRRPCCWKKSSPLCPARRGGWPRPQKSGSRAWRSSFSRTHGAIQTRPTTCLRKGRCRRRRRCRGGKRTTTKTGTKKRGCWTLWCWKKRRSPKPRRRKSGGSWWWTKSKPRSSRLSPLPPWLRSKRRRSRLKEEGAGKGQQRVPPPPQPRPWVSKTVPTRSAQPSKWPNSWRRGNSPPATRRAPTRSAGCRKSSARGKGAKRWRTRKEGLGRSAVRKG